MLMTRFRSEPQRFHRWRRGEGDAEDADEGDDDEGDGDVDDGEVGSELGIKNKTRPVPLCTRTLCGPCHCAAPHMR